MSAMQDYYYWSLVHAVQHNKECSIIHTNRDGTEVWFDCKVNGEKTTFRVARKSFSWENDLQKDQVLAFERAEGLRKQRFQRRMIFHNIYIIDFEPLQYDGREQKDLQLKKVKVKLERYVGEQVYEIESLFSHLDLAVPNVEGYSEEQFLHQAHQIRYEVLSQMNTERKEEERLFQYGKPFFTYIFLVAQILMFLFLEWKGSSEDPLTLIEYGAKYNPLILEGEWWRFFTPIIIHIGVFHLLMNSLALYYLGTLVERMYGSARFLFIYIAAGFAGVLGSFVWTSNLSAGASGAIFGCFGALLFLARTNPRVFFRTIGYNVLALIVINLIFGLVVPGIDNAGHIGGLVGGFLAASIVSLPKKPKLYVQIPAFVSTVLLVLGLLYYGFSIRTTTADEPYALSLASEYIKQKKYEVAIKSLDSFVERDTNNALIYYLRGYAYTELKEYERAEQELKESVRLDSNFHEGYYYLALLNAELNHVDEAKENVEKALEIEPANKEYQYLQRKLN
ncbi:rhomboid family protein [Priestia flexa]|uniref:rhomboid family protein n=1 Tax=Priestia flexa TaxID=86664 RepID=UPI00195692E2|nr:rhomboid family intramembrane serine protease [Priestia flexa]